MQACSVNNNMKMRCWNFFCSVNLRHQMLVGAGARFHLSTTTATETLAKKKLLINFYGEYGNHFNDEECLVCKKKARNQHNLILHLQSPKHARLMIQRFFDFSIFEFELILASNMNV